MALASLKTMESLTIARLRGNVIRSVAPRRIPDTPAVPRLSL